MTSSPWHSPSEILKQVAQRTLAYDFTVWFWGDAIAIDGLLDAAELLNDPRPAEHCRRFYKVWSQRQLSWVDHLTPGLGLLRLYESTGDHSLLEAAVRLAHWLTEVVPNAPESCAPLYRPDIPPYRHNVWVDTIYHEPSFFCRLARITGETKYYDSAHEIWASHIRVLSSARDPLLAHAYDTGARLTRGYGWGRGQGWALFGMLDTLELLPSDHPAHAQILSGFKPYACAVVDLQDASGFWHTLMHDRESYLESSTAAFLGATFTKAVRLGFLDASYSEPAERAWQAVLSRIDGEGNFWGVSACTHAAVAPGDDTSIYRTLPTEVNVWGQGSALRFAAERIRAGKS